MKKLFPLAVVLMIQGCATQPEFIQFGSGYKPGDLASTNSYINDNMWYESDLRQFGQSDQWDTQCRSNGDCEDYALCKARKLLEARFDRKRLQILVVEDQSHNVLHAVLVVDKHTVLDNLHDEPVELSSLPYKPFYACGLNGMRYIYLEKAGGGYTEIVSPRLQSVPKCVAAFATLGIQPAGGTKDEQ